jgi:hypothetical protein
MQPPAKSVDSVPLLREGENPPLLAVVGTMRVSDG